MWYISKMANIPSQAAIAAAAGSRWKWIAIVLGAVAALVGIFCAIFFSLAAALKSSDAYRLGVAQVKSSAEAASLLGAPIEAGIPLGSVTVSGGSGAADLSFAVKGSKAKGTVYLEATRKLGKWKLGRSELEVDGREQRIDLNGIST